MFSGRLRMVLWVSLIVVLALFVVGGLRRVQYMRSPQYSVEQLARAATAKDWEGVQKYADVDAVVDDQVDKLIDGTLGGDDSWLGGLGYRLWESKKPKATSIPAVCAANEVIRSRHCASIKLSRPAEARSQARRKRCLRYSSATGATDSPIMPNITSVRLFLMNGILPKKNPA